MSLKHCEKHDEDYLFECNKCRYDACPKHERDRGHVYPTGTYYYCKHCGMLLEASGAQYGGGRS